ncbi:hypothetical protein ACFQ0B_44985 [Nonomuraea thailandensis]
MTAPSASAATSSPGQARDLVNPGFENPRLDGWKVTGRAAGVAAPGRTGNQALTLTGTGTVEQTVRVPDGIYTVSAWARSSGGQKSAYLFAGNGRTALPPPATGSRSWSRADRHARKADARPAGRQPGGHHGPARRRGGRAGRGAVHLLQGR